MDDSSSSSIDRQTSQASEDDTHNASRLPDRVSLTELIVKNQPLFGVMGIFGAVTIYLGSFASNFGADRRLIGIGVASSLFLFLLVFELIQLRIIRSFDGVFRFVPFLMYTQNDNSYSCYFSFRSTRWWSQSSSL